MAIHPRKFFRTNDVESTFAVNLNVKIHYSQQFRFYGGPFHSGVDHQHGVACSANPLENTDADVFRAKKTIEK